MDVHSELLLQEFRDARESYEKLKEVVDRLLGEMIARNSLYITAFESRVKSEKSFAGKLELKGQKYRSVRDVTDLFGARIITFYNDEVDKVAALTESLLEIDWENSADKRKITEADRFGYMSVHYICRVPKALYFDPEHPELNELRFEVQIRTALQHVWATVTHDIGYKSDVDIPKEYLRRLSCMAGLLELADREFLSFRTEVDDYRRKVRALLRDGRFDDITLDADSYRSYLELDPFTRLNERIASINHAEIQEVSLRPYLDVLSFLGLKTLGDVERMKNACFDDAYNLARYQFGNTDLDILSSSVGISSLCAVYLLKQGGGQPGLVRMYELLYGEQPKNAVAAKRIAELARKLNLIE